MLNQATAGTEHQRDGCKWKEYAIRNVTEGDKGGQKVVVKWPVTSYEKTVGRGICESII